MVVPSTITLGSWVTLGQSPSAPSLFHHLKTSDDEDEDEDVDVDGDGGDGGEDGHS